MSTDLLLTSLRRAKILARGRRAGASSASLLNAQSSALNFLALQTLLGGLSLIRGDHLDESKSTRFLGVRVAHDLALLNVTIFLKHLGDLSLRQTRVNASHEEV